jgi:hypothetical protein
MRHGAALPPNCAITHRANRPSARRRERRAAYRVLCRLIVENPNNGERVVLIGQTVNVSESGLAVRVAHVLEIGTYVRAVIPREHGDPAVYDGVVAHCRRVLAVTYELGIEFLEY